MPRVAIVIVTYNSGSEIGACLDALRDLGDVEILVVDNASSDGTRKEVESRGVRLLASPVNLGFAGGVNAGVRATSAPLILLLNPDAHLVRGLDEMCRRLETNGCVGIVGGRLTDGEGRPQTGFMTRRLPTPAALAFEVLGLNRLWPDNPINWQYRCRGMDPMTAGPTEQPAGAFLMFPRVVWETVHGFDESFMPVWFEDVDFCARVKRAGFTILYEPAGIASHAGGHSVSLIPSGDRQKYWYGNLLKYADKHFGVIGFRVVCAAVALGSLLRAAGGWPRRSSTVASEYGAVRRLAVRRLFSARSGFGGAVQEQHGVKVDTKMNGGADPR